MSTDTWHVSDEALQGYAQSDTTMAVAASIEAHLLHCPDCRGRLATEADEPLEAAWALIADRIQVQPAPLAVRGLQRLGCRDDDAVLLCAARSLTGAWTLAIVAVVTFAALAAALGASQGEAAYLLIAPLVPVLGVVAAFGSADPLADLASATPYSKARLALVRTGAVLVTSVPPTIAAGAVVPGIGWVAVAWLMPALALTLITLVGLTWWATEPVGAGVVTAWLAVVATAYAGHDVAAAVRVELQLVYLVLAALAAVALTLRMKTTSTPGGYA